MSELWQLGALELAEKIRSGEATSRAVVASAFGIPTPIDPILE